MLRPMIALALVAACGSKSAETPVGTEVLVVPLESFASPPADVRARLVAATPAKEAEAFKCNDATVEIAFERKRDPQTSAQYIDALRVRVVDPGGAVITAQRLNPTNFGTETAVEMALPIVVSVDRHSSLGQCSYRVRATATPAISVM